MIDKARLFEQLIQVFLGELAEHVRVQNECLLALEQSPVGAARQEILRNLLRSAHSLKGAARAVSLSPIEKLCHHVEELLGAVDRDERHLDKPAFELLFAAVDALDDAGKRLHEGHGLDGAPVELVTKRFSTASPTQIGAKAPLAASAGLLGQTVTAAPASLPEATSLPSRTLMDPTAVGYVRVAAQKLDQLLTLASELSVARSHLDVRVQDVDAIVDVFSQLRAEWHRLERPLDKLAVGDWPGVLPLSFRKSFDRARALVGQLERDLERLSTSMRTTTRACHGIAAAIDADVKGIRMLPFADVATGISRTVRDLALERGKEVEVVVCGGDVELDRYILEGLKDPLVHLVRNAVDHGIELPDVRTRSGKPARGRIEITATLRGSQVEISVTDDGAGLDAAAIVARALEHGFVSDASVDDFTRLVFLPGLSTSSEVTLVSGRGLGLDIVKSRVESLHGQVDVASQPGGGARFALIVPLTITTLRAVVVEVSGQLFALPSTSVERMVRMSDDDLRFIEGRAMFVHDGALLEVISLAQLLGLGEQQHDELDHDTHVVVISGRGHAVGLVVDRLVLVDEILVKNLGRRLRRVRYVGGATVLETGRVALILNSGEIIAALPKLRAVRTVALPRRVAHDKPLKRRILVVDDSPTTRTLNRTILEAAGFEVTVAVDGQDALRILEERGADLVLTDVEMPRMDGFALTEAIRVSRVFSKLPVVLMTGLGTEQDKARGLEAGADAYLVKSAFDKDQLLDVIHQLL